MTLEPWKEVKARREDAYLCDVLESFLRAVGYSLVLVGMLFMFHYLGLEGLDLNVGLLKLGPCILQLLLGCGESSSLGWRCYP